MSVEEEAREFSKIASPPYSLVDDYYVCVGAVLIKLIFYFLHSHFAAVLYDCLYFVHFLTSYVVLATSTHFLTRFILFALYYVIVGY
jgi:hypothetical protein